MKNTKQHYVPRFILKNFTLDSNSKFINAFNRIQNKFYESIPYKEQCQRKNFYGNDKVVETILSQIESEASIILRNIIKNPNIIKNLNTNEKQTIHTFLILQMGRTQGAIEEISSWEKTFHKGVNSLKPSEMEIIKEIPGINLSEDNKLPFSMQLSLKSILFSYDLEIALLFANNKSFIISDNPIIITNPYVRIQNFAGTGLGIGCIGILIILPYSPEYSICLYDSSVYKLENKYLHFFSENDTDRINRLSIYNSVNNIYFNNSLNKSYIEYLYNDEKLKDAFNHGKHDFIDLSHMHVDGKSIGKKNKLMSVRKNIIKFDNILRSLPISKSALYFKPSNEYNLVRAPIELIYKKNI